jgi:large subunit ribosomal protein L18
MTKTNPRQLARLTRQARVRRKVRGTSERPRLCVFRSASHIYAQVIDDDQGVTVAAASTLSPDLQAEIKGLKKVEAAKAVGLAVAKAAKNRGCGKVVFDRNGFLYHGRVKALSEGAREGGLEF